MNSIHPYQIYSLGDHALTIELNNNISEKINQQILSLHYFLLQQTIIGIKDIIPAYSSLTVVYDVSAIKEKNAVAYTFIKQQIEQAIKDHQPNYTTSRLIEIPVCYDLSFGIDLEEMAAQKNMSTQEIIQLHSNKIYRVYMIGFLPGFAYMGLVHKKIITPRKAQPRTKIIAGSVGIAGEQTGIYPFDSPGGWNIIGQTPLQLFNAKRKEPVLLQAGDSIQFLPIGVDEFYQIKNQQ